MKATADFPKYGARSNSQVRMTDVKIVYPWKLDGVLKLSGSLYADTEFIEGDVHYIRSPDEKEPLIFNE